MDARDRIAELEWWHTIDLAPGLVTPGPWDLRPTAHRDVGEFDLVFMGYVLQLVRDPLRALETVRRGCAVAA